MPSIAIVGIGRLGGALAIALGRHGYDVRELIHRSPVNALTVGERLPSAKLSAISEESPILADILLIATPDPEIASVSARLRRRVRRDAVVLHTSGSLGSDILSTFSNPVGSVHPLVSISDSVTGSARFTDAYFCIEGDPLAISAAEKIVEALGGRPFSVETRMKPLYHASAVMASGNFVALEDMAVEMLAKCGLSRDAAKSALIPLIRSTLANFEAQSNENALTGTFARADLAAFERHLESFLGPIPEQVRATYLLLAERSLDLAQKKGVDPKSVEALKRRLASEKRVAKGDSE